MVFFLTGNDLPPSFTLIMDQCFGRNGEKRNRKKDKEVIDMNHNINHDRRGITNKQLMVTKTNNHLHVLPLISSTEFEALRDNGGVTNLSLRKSSSLSLESDFLH